MKIKNSLLIVWGLLFLIAGSLNAQTKSDILTNETVTMLHKKGLGAGIIINKIKTSKTAFDVSTDALIKLKDDSIPDDIVSTMIESADKNKVEIVDLNDPAVTRSSGIYHFNPQDSSKLLTRIDPTVVSGGKTGGVGQALALRYTGGLANMKSTSVLSGSNAHKQIKSGQLVFYFYFDRNKGNLNQMGAMNWWFATASSPNEFALIRLDPKKDSREFTTGKANAYGHTTGIDEAQKVRFDYIPVSEGIFKVIITSSLPPGEYCFIYTGATPSMYSNDKVFDFGTF